MIIILKKTVKLTKRDVKNLKANMNCAHCGTCRNYCRVYNNTFLESDFAGGRLRIIEELFSRRVKCNTDELISTVFKCMLCGMCKEVCPAGVDTVKCRDFHGGTGIFLLAPFTPLLGR